jgi:hypothetical protein
VEPHDTTARPSLLSSQRPGWQRLLIWGGIVFAALNILPLVSLIAGNLFGPGSVLRGWGSLLMLVLLPFLPLLGFLLYLPFDGINLLRTAGNSATAAFTRRDDPRRDGYLYDVRPARMSWLTVLVPLPLFIVLGVLTAGIGMLFWPAFVAIFVLPGARYRKPVTIAVSSHGIESGDVNLPLDRVADLEVGNNGVKVSEEPLMPGPGGVSTSAIVGRGLGKRQAARSYTLAVRGDGQSSAAVIAGGLTYDCAVNLRRDIENALVRLGAAQ